MTRATARIDDPVDCAIAPDRQVAGRSLGWAEMVLRRQDMPPDEVRVAMTSTDRVLVRQTLELHLERLEERLIAQRRSLAEIERILARDVNPD